MKTDDTTLAAIDDTLELDWTGPIVSGGTGTGKTNGSDMVAATLRAEYELLSAVYRETVRRYEHLRAAAQAAVIELRTSRRNPITPILEALTELGELPAPGARLREQMPQTAAAWPTGAVG